jgi:hypothetical protein
MSENEYTTIISLVVDSEGKLVGLLGDEDDVGCPAAFAPSSDLIGAIRFFLLHMSREVDDYIEERGLFQLMLERLDTAYAKLIKVLEEGDD